MKTKKNNLFLCTIFLLLAFGCNDAVKVTEPGTAKQRLNYVASTGQDGSDGIDYVSACTLAGPKSEVVIAKLVSNSWEERVCGEEIPESRVRYTVDVSDDVFGIKSGEIELLGMFEALPNDAVPGDTFLIGYRSERGENYIMQWAQIVYGESNTENRKVTLPSEKGELLNEIRIARDSTCSSIYPGFNLPDAALWNWSHKDCGDDTVEKPQDSEPTSGDD